ncbi:hypothetical protein BD769DRAFT_909825 [Suillus cothurnatus]|nr:hypothetical protein BD769DRAFT_909825 [Suillus cothurnatus]
MPLSIQSDESYNFLCTPFIKFVFSIPFCLSMLNEWYDIPSVKLALTDRFSRLSFSAFSIQSSIPMSIIPTSHQPHGNIFAVYTLLLSLWIEFPISLLLTSPYNSSYPSC